MGLERQNMAVEQGKQIKELLEQNTTLTQEVQKLAGQIESFTREIHNTVCRAHG